MKICPSCKEEFLDEISRCILCEKDLLDEDDAKLIPKQSELLSKEELLKSETVVFTEGPLGQCRELENILNKKQISCAIYPVTLTAGNAAIGAASEMKYCVLVRVSDIESAQEALQGHFHAQVLKEGRGELKGDVVDLSQEFITCPACLETVTLIDGDCPSCGLGLGV